MSDPIDADEAFGPPSADEAFPPPTQREQRARVHATLGGSPMQDFIFGDADLEGSAANHFRGLFNVARSMRDAFKEHYVADPIAELSEGTAGHLKENGLAKDYAEGQKEITDAADNTFMKPAATEKALESFARGVASNPVYQAASAGVRGFNAAFAAAQRGIYVAGQEYGFPKLAADLAAFPEAFQGSFPEAGIPKLPSEKPVPATQRVLSGLPEHPPLTAAELERAKSLGVLESEEAWKNGVPPAPAEAGEAVAAPAAPAQAAAAAAEPAGIHDIARSIAPDAIKEFDELTKRRDTFRRWMEDRESTPPANLKRSIEETEARLKELEPEITAAYDKARAAAPAEAAKPAEPSTAAQAPTPEEGIRTGEPHIDAVLSHPDVADAIANPKVNRTQDVPYTAGPDKTGNGLNIDKHFPESFTIEGKTFDPAQPFAVHEFTERHAMETLTAGGMDDATAYKVAHWEVAEPAEGKWYEENGIDQGKAEAAYQPFIDKIEHEKLAKGDGDVPANLYRKPYPHDSVDAAAREKAPVPKPTAEEIARGREILAKGEGQGKTAQGAPLEAPKGRSIEDQRATIAHDVGAQLVKAGRLPEEAAAAAQLIAARYIARAERMKGALGTPEELYRREGAEIRAMEIRRKVAGARNPPAMARALDDFQQRMAAGKEAAAKRRNEGSSAVRIMTTAEKYAGVTEEEFNAAQKEAEAAAPELKTMLTDDDWEFLGSGEFHQRRTAPPGPDLFTQREAEGQTNLPGTERISEADLAKRRAAEPMKPGVAQKPMDFGLFSDEAKQRELFQREAAPPFYSAVARTIESAKQAKASPDQWLATIRNTPGIKAEEMEWLGLEDWLKSQKGSVTKDQVADYVRANQIEVKEVTRGEPTQLDRHLRDQIAESNRQLVDLNTRHAAARYARRDTSAIDQRINEHRELIRDAEQKLSTSGEPKFGQYTLPGGENHRELLLTLPPKPRIPLVKFKVRPGLGGHAVWDDVGNQWGVFATREIAEKEAARRTQNAAESSISAENPENFQVPPAHGYGSRESDVNRLAHIFMDDRTIDGKKTLLIKEAQSDWHSKGRHEGYFTAEAKKESEALKAENAKLMEDMYQKSVTRDPVTNRMADEAGWHALARQREANLARIDQLGGHGVPDAPFKTTWQELVLKRMIRYAAEHSYEQLAWVTGEERAAKYDVSKQVKEINVTKESNGTFTLDAVSTDGKPLTLGEAVKPEAMAEIIGKELSEKIAAQTEDQKSYSGLDLKVGGRMHRLLYDEQFPQAANKLGKKFGARVGQSEVEPNRKGWHITPPDQTVSGKWMVKSSDYNSKGFHFDTEEEARANLEQQIKGEREAEPVHTIPITDKLREAAVEQGFPLFQKALGSFLPRGEGKPGLIKLAKDANASTFIHESGHDFLEQMMRDAAHEAAPEEVRADAETVKRWLGIESHEDLNTGWPGERGKAARRAHEKFARGFEQYLREGVAPSQALARVFAQFKQWLTQIYQTLRGLGEPINDDIRRVFDRMLTRPDEATIAPERPGVETFADRHETAAESTVPEAAHETAETVQAESDNVAARHLPPDLHDARLANITEETGRREPGGPELDRHGNEPEAPARNGGAAAEPGAVEAGGGQAAAEGAAARTEPAAGPTVKTKPPASATARFEDDKAGNIVIPNLNTSEDVAAVIRKTASENNNFQEVRGPIPDSEVMALAEAMGMDPAYLDTRKIGEAWTAPQIVALRHLLIKSAAAVRDAMVKAATGNPESLMEYAEAKARHVMIQKTVSSVTAEAGRALRAFQGRFTEGMAEANQIGAFLKNATGKTLFQLQQEARFGAKLETPQQLALFIDSSERKGFASAVIEYYVNALISGPVTHLRYMAGNQIKLLATPLFEIPVGAAVGKFREITGAGPQADRVYLGEIAPALYGIMKGSRDGIWKALDVFKTGVSEPLPTERISPHFMMPGGAIPGPIGTVLRTPGRSVSAIHTFFKMATYEMSIQRLAYRAAMNEGLEGQDFTNRVAELTVRPTSTMMTQATRTALKELFMAPTDYNSVSGQLTRAFNNPSPAGIALKVIAPFMKIGTQIMSQAFVERTPIGAVVSKEVRENLSFKGGEMGQGAGAAFDEQMAKQITGIALIGASVGLALEGIMTGDGPEDPNKRAVWRLSHRPNSIQIGDITIPYQGLGGLGMLMRFSANMTHTAEGWDENDGTKLAVSFVTGFAESVLGESFMRGFKDMLDAVFHFKEYGPNYIRQFATNWLPFSVGMSQVARMVDPYQRDTANDIFKAAQAKVPWLSERLMPRRDMFGEPIPNSASEAIARYANDPVVKAMDDLNFGVGKLKRDIRGVELTDEQYDELAMKAGRMAKMRLDRIVAMPGFSTMSPEMRLELMHKAINQSRETARKLLMIEYPEILRAATDNKVGKKMGTVPVNEKPKQTVH